MSPNNKKKLIVLRKKLDLLDNQLIKILKKRFIIVQNVLKLKEKKSDIIDRKRINVILNSIKKKSKKNKIDTRICLLYTTPSPRDKRQTRMPSSA